MVCTDRLEFWWARSFNGQACRPAPRQQASIMFLVAEWMGGQILVPGTRKTESVEVGRRRILKVGISGNGEEREVAHEMHLPQFLQVSGG